MDWSKVKNIMIVVFVFLNLFLLVYTGIYKSQNNISENTVTSIINILDKSGVKIKTGYKLPVYSKKKPMLIMENYNLNRNDILNFLLYKKPSNEIDKIIKNQDKNSFTEGDKTITFTGAGSFIYNDPESSISINNLSFDKANLGKDKGDFLKGNSTEIYLPKDSKQFKKTLKKFHELFLNMNINVSSFTLDKIIINSDNSYTFVFVEVYNKYLVFGNRILVTTVNDGLNSIDFSMTKINGFTKKASSIMPIHQVLLKNYYAENRKNNNTTIISITIGFKGFNDESEYEDRYEYDKYTKSIVQSPSWRIIMDDGSERFFKAYDGEEIK